MAERKWDLRFLVADQRRHRLPSIWLYQLVTWEAELRGGRHRRTRAERPAKSPAGGSAGHDSGVLAA